MNTNPDYLQNRDAEVRAAIAERETLSVAELLAMQVEDAQETEERYLDSLPSV